MEIKIDGISNKIVVDHQFTNLEEPTYESIFRLIEMNLTNKLHGLLLRVQKNHPDSEIQLHVTLEKNKLGKFDGIFVLNYAGIVQDFHGVEKSGFRYERDDFEKLDDLVNHAFANFKERFANNK